MLKHHANARRCGSQSSAALKNSNFSCHRHGMPAQCPNAVAVAGICGRGNSRGNNIQCGSTPFDILWSAPVATSPVKPREPAETHGLEWDVLGIGQTCIDYASAVDDHVLQQLNVPKGGRRVISVAERASVMQSLEGHNTQVSAGGSLANTLVGLAQLAAAQERAAAHRQQQQQHLTSSLSNPSSSSSSSSSGHVSSPQHSQQQHHTTRVALTGPVTGADALGEFAAAQLRAAGVAVVGPKPTSSSTGTVMVFSTPDAQRSFLSCFSDEDSISFTGELAADVSRARLLVIEGYLWEVQGAAEAIPAIVQHARSCGTLVALTAGDAGVVQRHGSKVLGAIAAGVDILFSNEAEAAALVAALEEQQQAAAETSNNNGLVQQQQQQHADLNDAEEDYTAEQLMQLCSTLNSSSSSNSSSDDGTTAPASTPAAAAAAGTIAHQHHHHSGSAAEQAALQLASICPMVAVTDGSRGSYITALGQLVVVPPFWKADPPVDTCGAGDAWAAGFLHGLLIGLDLHSMGHVAAKTASAVISRHGPQLLAEDADWVVAGLSRPAAGLAGIAGAAGAAAAATARAAALRMLRDTGSNPSASSLLP